MPTHPTTPNFLPLLTSLPRLTRTTTHHLLRACQDLKRDWHSLSHPQRLRILRLAVQRYGPRGKQYLREKQKVVARGMAMLQLWMYRGIRVRPRGVRGVVGRKARRVGAGRGKGRGKGRGSSVVSAGGSGEAPPQRETREVVMAVEDRDTVIPVATHDAGTQTSEAATSSQPCTSIPGPTISTAAVAVTASSSTTTIPTPSSSSSILPHQLAHLHAEFSSLQHAFFALQASNSSLHNSLLDQQSRNRSLLHELRAGKWSLETEVGRLKGENGRLRGFVERVRDEARGLLGWGMRGMGNERNGGEGGGGEDSGIGGEM